MSDLVQHECGIAMVRLLKPLSYFYEKYGTCLYGFNKLLLLMEKQHNRGQDGVGIGSVKIDMPLGQPYLFRSRSAKSNSLSKVFGDQMKKFKELEKAGILSADDPDSVRKQFQFGGEILMGHLRYGTSGQFTTGSCHPYVRRNNYKTKTLMVLGNFNMTNAPELSEQLINRGQHPIFDTDTQTVLEELGYHLDEQHTDIYREMRDKQMPGTEIPLEISERLDLGNILRESACNWDGGYVIGGAVGNGDAFVMRDPHGIRPCFYYRNDELIAFASERVPLMTIFDVYQDAITELAPGHAVTIKNDGRIDTQPFVDEFPEPAKCTFERIYFSRGNDPDIYTERKDLGNALVPQILDSIDGDCIHTVFSFIPNTAEIAYHGMMHGLRVNRREQVKKEILKAAEAGTLNESSIDDLIMRNWPRGEKLAHKDIKMRTFIAQESGRNQLVSHVYDISYGVVQNGDNLVVIDDSIVRGTTLKKSILRILSRTDPKKIVIASTAPQIRYPDFYGIDMSEIGKFIAFQAAISLLRNTGRGAVIEEVYQACKKELKKPPGEMTNRVKAIYKPFSAEEISAQISEIVSPRDIPWKGDVQVVFQTIENLHKAVPNHSGDWYFTGDYPTSGGYAMVNQAFINYYDKVGGRTYDLLFT